MSLITNVALPFDIDDILSYLLKQRLWSEFSIEQDFFEISHNKEGPTEKVFKFQTPDSYH